MIKVTDHFSLAELTHSEVAARQGIPNLPPLELMPNLKRTAEMLEYVRRLLGCPILVHSAYRCEKVNELVGGSKTSAHLQGLAADIVAPDFGSPVNVAFCINESGFPFDQLILEYGWVHIGLAKDGEKPRQQVLTKHSATSPYESGLVS